jgi:glycosyltransferase involved in cell wall biosynthesis
MKTVNVLVNGRSLARRVTGVERYATEIVRCLGDRVRIVRPAGNYQGLAGHAWEQVLLPGQVTGGSILWSPANTGPLAVSNQVLTVHDLTPLEHPQWFKPAFAAWYRMFLPVLVQRVKRVITTSEHVRQKIIAGFHLPQGRVAAIPAGINLDRFYRQDRPQRYGRYILFVGSIEPRKNLETLLKAWGLVEKQHRDVSLVITGISGPVFRKVQLASRAERLHLTGYVPDEALPSLYSGADVFILPSFDEGFGLTVLEAMACGTPVVASNQGALPEVTGEAGILFDPDEPAALAEIISQCLSDLRLRKSLSRQGLERVQQFSWQTTAERVWQTLQGVYEN